MNDPFRPLRRAFRAWRNRKRLEQEQMRYRKLFHARGLSIPAEADMLTPIE
jgi:hypothetical protein